MSPADDVDALRAEVAYYRDSIALLRARLYRRSLTASPRLDDLQRRLRSAEVRLGQAQPGGAAPPDPPA